MFIHNGERCKLNLWSPVDTENQYTEDVSFSVYSKHEQEKEDIIQRCLREYEAGNFNFSVDIDDDFSESDLEYIRNEVLRRLH